MKLFQCFFLFAMTLNKKTFIQILYTLNYHHQTSKCHVGAENGSRPRSNLDGGDDNGLLRHAQGKESEGVEQDVRALPVEGNVLVIETCPMGHRSK